MELLKKLYREEEAQGMTEYTLILAAVVGAIYAAVTWGNLGTALSTAFTTIGTKLASVINNS
jgi:Flp pilus assembly pilin Flp